jgi:hypothetical protein
VIRGREAIEADKEKQLQDRTWSSTLTPTVLVKQTILSRSIDPYSVLQHQRTNIGIIRIQLSVLFGIGIMRELPGVIRGMQIVAILRVSANALDSWRN